MSDMFSFLAEGSSDCVDHTTVYSFNIYVILQFYRDIKIMKALSDIKMANNKASVLLSNN